jgi:hypothetical protein
MKLYILEKDDSWYAIQSKMREEHDEALTAISNYIQYAKTTEQKKKLGHYAAGEILDIIQVSIGALDKLFLDRIDIDEEIKRHNQKLLNRGWLTRATIRMNTNYCTRKIV